MLSPSTIDSFKEISKLSLMISPIWPKLTLIEDETLLIFEETGIMEIKNSSSSEIPSLWTLKSDWKLRLEIKFEVLSSYFA